MPSLRERPTDIPLLAKSLLAKQCREQGSVVPELERDAETSLVQHSFPGNVRELENVLERALALCDGKTIRAEDLLLKEGQKAAPAPIEAQGLALPEYLEDIEKKVIMDALEKTRHNKTAAAKLLGMSFRALRYRLSKLGLGKDDD
jgi:two-component system response regulator PilR (NtrC family)